MNVIRSFLVLYALGLLGIVSLLPALEAGIARLRSMPGAPDMSDGAIAALLLAQPALLLALAVAAGLATAKRAGLRSLLLERLRGERGPAVAAREVGRVVALTIALALGALAMDTLFHRIAPAAMAGLSNDDTSVPLLSALLYGGLTEELLLRFGLMSALAWAGLRVFGAEPPGRRRAVEWGVILVVALAFGLGHLPALAADGNPDPVLIVRTVLVNALLGVLYGWLYRRFALEYAMASHALTHVVFLVASPAFGALAAAP